MTLRLAPLENAPEAILQPITDEQRAWHVWFTHPSTSTAVLCPTERCGEFLGALVADSAGTLRTALVHGRKWSQSGLYWQVKAYKRKANDLHRYDRMAQVPLSGRPGRVKLECPNCYRISRIVVARPSRVSKRPAAQPPAM